MTIEREISSVVKEVARTARGEIAIARCTDGTFGLIWDGTLIESLDWNSERFHECETFVEHLAASLKVSGQEAC